MAKRKVNKMPPRALKLQERCPICGEYEHQSPGTMNEHQIFKHRITENRDCPSYEGCLTAAALEDAVMVPCISCELLGYHGRHHD